MSTTLTGESIVEKKPDITPDTIGGLMSGLFEKIKGHLKVVIIMFFMILFFNTTFAVEKIFSCAQGAVDLSGHFTAKGTLLMDFAICMFYLLLMILVDSNTI